MVLGDDGHIYINGKRAKIVYGRFRERREPIDLLGELPKYKTISTDLDTGVTTIHVLGQQSNTEKKIEWKDGECISNTFVRTIYSQIDGMPLRQYEIDLKTGEKRERVFHRDGSITEETDK